MSHLRRTATVIAGLLISVLGLTAAAPAAFAMRLVEPNDAPGPGGATTLIIHNGMAGWEVTLIAVGAAVVAATLTAVASRARFHTSPHPLAS